MRLSAGTTAFAEEADAVSFAQSVGRLTAASAFAQGPWRGGMGRDGFDTLPLLIHSAGLNETQQAQVRQIIGNHRTQLRALREQLRTAETQLGDKLVASTPVTDTQRLVNVVPGSSSALSSKKVSAV